MSEPSFVLISDIHFSINTLEEARISLKVALRHAETLQVPLIIAGDTNDTKAILRAEVANTLIDILKETYTKVFMIVGNHDLINEKGREHSLQFLQPYVNVVNKLQYIEKLNTYLLPYLSDTSNFKECLPLASKKPIIVMHQGVKGAFMGDYIQDKSSIDPELLKDFTVYSGHYHRYQKVGTVQYIGNPYTLSFGESNDPGKGFLVVYQDGNHKRILLNLRKHIKLKFDAENLHPIEVNENDKLWVKIHGSRSLLDNYNKEKVQKLLQLPNMNFRLELLPDQLSCNTTSTTTDKHIILDKAIASLKLDEKDEKQVKSLWRNFT